MLYYRHWTLFNGGYIHLEVDLLSNGFVDIWYIVNKIVKKLSQELALSW